MIDMRLLFLFLLMLLGACSLSEVHDGAPARAPKDMQTGDAIPRSEAPSRYGNPVSYVVNGRRYHTLKSARGFVEKGVASWYGTKFHGRRTSSGEPYDMYLMTAAHKTLPLPSYVEVTNLNNGRSAVVRVNDRGPFHENRIIDLSYAAAKKLGIVANGTGLVEIRTVGPEYHAAPVPPVRMARDRSGQVNFRIQVGAFFERLNAERLYQRLKLVFGTLALIDQVRSQGRPLFRVQLGPLADVAQSDQIVTRLLALGLVEHRLVFE